MKFAVVTLLAGMMLAAPARAQKVVLKFDALAAKASDKAEFDLEGGLLRLLMRHGLGAKENDGKASPGDLLSGLREIHVRNYEFDQAGAYSAQDLEPLRQQLNTSAGWSRVLNVKEDEENTEIFVATRGGNITSCVIVSAAAKELTVVHLAGTLTLAQVKELGESGSLHRLADMTGDFRQ
jgi:hypothetical protein